MIRPQAVVLPLLRAALPGVAVVSQLPDVDHRTLPMVIVRRAGGTRNQNLPNRFAQPDIEMVAISADGLVAAEELHEAASDALYAAVRDQTVVEGVGYLQSLQEAQGPHETTSPIPDTWHVGGSFTLGLRASA